MIAWRIVGSCSGGGRGGPPIVVVIDGPVGNIDDLSVVLRLLLIADTATATDGSPVGDGTSRLVEGLGRCPLDESIIAAAVDSLVHWCALCNGASLDAERSPLRSYARQFRRHGGPGLLLHVSHGRGVTLGPAW